MGWTWTRKEKLFAFLLSGVAIATPAHAQQVSDAPPHAETRTLCPYFVVEGGDPSLDHVPLLGTEVQVDIAGVIADVTVKQTYRNDGTRPIHAQYVFPASTRAAVHGLVMSIDEHRFIAKIQEREAAKKEFSAAKKAGKNATLLEQQRPNVFHMNVANVMPGQQIDVELHYTELLVPEAGVYEFIYPAVVGPRYSTVPEAGAADTDLWLRSPYTPEGQTPMSTLKLAARLSAGLPIDSVQCPSHPIHSRWVSASRLEVSLDPEVEDGGNRDFVLRYRLDGGRIQTGLMLYEGENENFFLMMLQPPRHPQVEQIPPREYVFVVDVSGSMAGFPLATAKELVRDLAGHMRPTDSFNVVFFSGGSRLWSTRSRPATPENIADALRMLSGQNGGGGTELLAALKRALALPRDEGIARSLIIVSDGYIAAERDVFQHIRAHLGAANVFAFGIGSSVNRFLIEGIARAGQGEAFVVLEPGEAEAKARQFREYVQFPLLTDIRVTFEGLEVYDVQPEAVPDLLAARPLIVHGKWRGKRRGRLIVRGVSGLGGFQESFDVGAVEPAESNRALRHLWARQRIAAISDFGFSRETDDERRQLVELGLAYNLLTKHTSFIAIHERIVNPGGDGELVSQPLPLPAGVSDLAVGQLGVGDEPGLMALLVLSLAAVALHILLRRKPSRGASP